MSPRRPAAAPPARPRGAGQPEPDPDDPTPAPARSDSDPEEEPSCPTSRSSDCPSPSSAPAPSASPPPRTSSTAASSRWCSRPATASAPSIREWGHVRIFSPWEYDLDPVATELLAAAGWQAPEPDGYPTGDEIVERYLEPLAALPAIARRLHLRSRVVAVTKHGIDKLKDAGRDDAPFELIVEQDGGERRHLARAVIDASGTWSRPNPLGSGGVPAGGERDERRPDLLRHPRRPRRATATATPAGASLVVGSGHSAFNAILDLVALRDSEPATEIVWAIRGAAPGRKYGGGGDDQLPARGALGEAVRGLVDDGAIELVAGFQTRAIVDRGRPASSLSDGERRVAVDEVIAATGFRPDLSLLGELRLDLDDRVEAARALAPLIDPNLHSCGSVPPHGVDELAPPRRGRLHGRHEELRPRADVPAAHRLRAGPLRRRRARRRLEAARRVELVLPGDRRVQPLRRARRRSRPPRRGRGARPAAASAWPRRPCALPPRARLRSRAWAITGALSVTETVSYGILYYAFAASWSRCSATSVSRRRS